MEDGPAEGGGVSSLNISPQLVAFGYRRTFFIQHFYQVASDVHFYAVLAP